MKTNITIQQILQTKGNDVWSISPDDSVQDALEVMANKNIGSLLVIEKDHVQGIVSERDYARCTIQKKNPPHQIKVREIMTENVQCVQSDQTIEDCMSLMTDKRIRHLPVIENDQVVGVISIGDIVKAVISEQEFMIEQLENYICGGRA